MKKEDKEDMSWKKYLWISKTYENINILKYDISHIFFIKNSENFWNFLFTKPVNFECRKCVKFVQIYQYLLKEILVIN